MAIEINQLKIITQVNSNNKPGQNQSGTDTVAVGEIEKEEIIQECLRRLQNYLQRLQEA